MLDFFALGVIVAVPECHALSYPAPVSDCRQLWLEQELRQRLAAPAWTVWLNISAELMIDNAAAICDVIKEAPPMTAGL